MCWHLVSLSAFANCAHFFPSTKKNLHSVVKFYKLNLGVSSRICRLLRSHIVVDIGSAILVNLFHGSDLDLHPLETLLLNYKHIMSSFGSCNVTHIHRERNMVANCLANRSVDQEIGICKLPFAPDFVISTVLDDITGLARPRIISVVSTTS